MSISNSMRRLRTLIDDRDPAWIAAPGATDEDIRRLRDAVAPLVLPAEVEALYRWHDGFSLPVLDGYGVQCINDLLAARAFEIEQLRFPPAWLVLSEPPGGGGNRLFVTLTTAEDRPYAPIWSVETDDAGVQLMYESLSAVIEAFCDMVQEVAAGVAVAQVGRTSRDDLPRGVDEYRLARSPGAFVFPNPPTGTATSRFVDADWPEPWLTSIGTTSSALRARGGARPIADLGIVTNPHDFPFRIVGEVDQLSGTGEVFDFRISDATGSVWVHSVTRQTLLGPGMRQRLEVDLERHGTQYDAVAIRRVG